MKTVSLWVSSYGDIVLPADFPAYALTKSGWWDKRYTADARVKAAKLFLVTAEARLIEHYA
jgi:hypothetical protein